MSEAAKPNDQLTQYRLATIEETLASINETLRQLTALEQKHLETRQALERAFATVAEQEKRLRKIEIELPTLKMIRGWVISGVIGCAGLLGVTLFKVATHL